MGGINREKREGISFRILIKADDQVQPRFSLRRLRVVLRGKVEMMFGFCHGEEGLERNVGA